jgi:hypothetical protein
VEGKRPGMAKQEIILSSIKAYPSIAANYVYSFTSLNAIGFGRHVQFQTLVKGA